MGPFCRFIQLNCFPTQATWIIDIWLVFHNWLGEKGITGIETSSAFQNYGCQAFLPSSFCKLIESEDVIKIGHGMRSDAEALMRTFGLKLRGTIDTQLLWVEGTYIYYLFIFLFKNYL